MEDNLGTRLNGIRQIVKLKEIIQRWQHVTIGARGNDDSDDSPTIGNHPGGGINPAISMRLKGYTVYSDSDIEDGCQSPDPPNDVPKGYLAVYVGPELRRFIIPTSYLSDPLFKVLLEKSKRSSDLIIAAASQSLARLKPSNTSSIAWNIIRSIISKKTQVPSEDQR